LETTTWWTIDVVAVWTEELHRVETWDIGASTGDDIASIAQHTRT